MSAVFLVSIGIAFINASAAKYFWLLIWVNSRVLDHFYGKKRRALDTGQDIGT